MRSFTMHRIAVKAAVIATAVCASAAAHATSTYNFTYSFGDGQQISGYFTGTSTDGGQLVTNVSNLQVSLNGIAFAPVTVGANTFGNATLQANNWNSGTVSFDNTTPVTIYANGALNHFVISDVDASQNTNPDYEFAYINDSANSIYEVVAANFLQSDSFSAGSTQLAIDTPAVAASWSLTQVPVPGALPLLASGLGLAGLVSRRRRAA